MSERIFTPGSEATRALFALALLVVSVGAVIDAGSSPAATLNDKIQHVLAFGLLAVLASVAFPRSSPWTRVLPGLLGYGLLMECVQGLLPWREFSLLDLMADLCGAVLALGAIALKTRAGGGQRT